MIAASCSLYRLVDPNTVMADSRPNPLLQFMEDEK